MTDADPASITPRPANGCDVRSLPLGPMDAFLLSRIDGSLSASELATLTGFDLASVEATISRLVELGAVVVGPAPSPPGAAAAPDTRRSEQGAHRDASALSGETPPGEGPIDLDEGQQRKILEVFAQLESTDYYALLGVMPDADKKEIKKAYYAVAPSYHPDRHFRKNLGHFKARMEAIFARMTSACDTLCTKETRAEYDGYLATQREIRRMEQLLAAPISGYPEPKIAEPPGPSMAPSVPLVPSPSKPPGAAAATPQPSPGSAAPSSSSPPVRTPEEDRARRVALARKLGGARASLPPQGAPISRPPQSQGSLPPSAALQDLKRRQAAGAKEGIRAKVRQYVDAAEQALAQKNLAAAANAYRLARTLEPDDLTLAAAHEKAAKLAAAALADGYLKQADYEARAGHWREAAHSYVRAVAGMPEDGAVLLKAAAALLNASGDLHHAADLAKRAVQLSPRRLEPRLLLAEIYVQASRPLLARRELEAAREIAPQDDRVKELGRRIK